MRYTKIYLTDWIRNIIENILIFSVVKNFTVLEAYLKPGEEGDIIAQ